MTELSTIFIGIIIIIAIVAVSVFIESTHYKIAYFTIVGLAFLCLTNMYLTVFYYVKLRSSDGPQGAPGVKGKKGPRGDPGKCSFSATCGIDNPRPKIINVASNYYNIPEKCLSQPTTDNCSLNNDDDGTTTLERALQIEKQINILEDMAHKTSMAEQDFMDKLWGNFTAPP